MERKVGEIFTYNGKTYQVVKTNTCKDCAFSNTRCNSFQTLVAGTCTPGGRKDNINVAFKEINNMEIKNNQLTIDIPEGMEIDLENSDLAKGIVKFKKHDITYENIEDALKLGKNCKSIIINESNASKLVALSRLMNIAKYYNGDWKPDWYSYASKFSISFNHTSRKYIVDSSDCRTSGNVLFKKAEDAQAVIDNPNFKDILDKIYKDCL